MHTVHRQGGGLRITDFVCYIETPALEWLAMIDMRPVFSMSSFVAAGTSGVLPCFATPISQFCQVMPGFATLCRNVAILGLSDCLYEKVHSPAAPRKHLRGNRGLRAKSMEARYPTRVLQDGGRKIFFQDTARSITCVWPLASSAMLSRSPFSASAVCRSLSSRRLLPYFSRSCRPCLLCAFCTLHTG